MDWKPRQILIMSRSWHEFSDQKFELKMDVSVVNESKTWSDFDHVTIWPQSDQVFWPFTTMICILSSNFWSRNCHDRDMIKNWWGFLAIYHNDLRFELELLFPKLLRSGFLIIYYNDLHFEVELLVPKLSRSRLANRTSVRQHNTIVSPRHPSLACSETKRGATCPAGVF